jgi:hypothetical protein
VSGIKTPIFTVSAARAVVAAKAATAKQDAANNHDDRFTLSLPLLERMHWRIG